MHFENLSGHMSALGKPSKKKKKKVNLVLIPQKNITWPKVVQFGLKIYIFAIFWLKTPKLLSVKKIN